MTDIPEDVMKAARDGLYAAYDELEERNGRFCCISDGMWDALTTASARAIMAERDACALRAARVIDSDEFSFLQRHSGQFIAAAIRKGEA